MDPTPTMAHALAELAADFDLLEDWEARFAHVIDLGRGLPPLPEGARTDAAKVRGCASQVWLITQLTPAGRLRFWGDSDSTLVKGLLAVLLALHDDRTPAEILAFDADAALGRLGLAGALTPQRSNGLAAMLRRVRGAAQEALTGPGSPAPAG